MNLKFCARFFCVVVIFLFSASYSFGGDVEFIGQFDKALVVNKKDNERLVFKLAPKDSFKGSAAFTETAHITTNRLQNPSGQASLVAALVEEEDEKPQIFVDLNADNNFTDDEKFTFKREKSDNPYLLVTTVNVAVKEGFFTSCPIFLRYYRDIKTSKMSDSDRLVEQSTGLYARGAVDVKGQKVFVQYAYSFDDRKVTPERGWLGVDADGDGEIDMDNLSFEAARASNETVVFRAGQTYVSTKRVDVLKNQIVLKENAAKEYKRVELTVGKELPDFAFVDLTGKKRKFSEFRGKYVILDFWGFWCPPCRAELPYLKEAYKRFQARGLEIVGMNTDGDYTPESIKKALNDNGITWTQARKDSFEDLKDNQLRIESFPTTFLISPDGKILSMSRDQRGEPELRGKYLLESLDKILPEK
jgi:thiol-disulfide isomerase/thioredoxin